MGATPAELAQAISGHRFDEAIPSISDGIVWELVGNGTLVGRDAVVEALRGTAEELADATTEFTRFLVVASDESVVVDSIAEYTDAEGDRTTVASCDVYEFEDGMIVRIRSYNVELD